MVEKWMSGITFNGKHSFADLGVTMVEEREIGFPSKIKNKIQLYGSNKTYDFSKLTGIQPYTERNLKYGFNIAGRKIRTKKEMNDVKTRVINAYMSADDKQRLDDPFYPDYYFMAEIESDNDFNEDWDTGILWVTFTAYPFMKRDRLEGDDIWDTFNFETDIAQNVRWESQRIIKGMPFKQLKVGDEIIVGPWANQTAYDENNTDEIQKINYQISQEKYKILAKRTVISDSPKAYGPTQYKIEEGVWIWEQDVLQAQMKPLEITVINNGIVAETPILKFYKQRDLPEYSNFNGFSIEKDGVFTHFRYPYENDTFVFEPGENTIKLYGYDFVIHCEFRYEVI